MHQHARSGAGGVVKGPFYSIRSIRETTVSATLCHQSLRSALLLTWESDRLVKLVRGGGGPMVQ